MIYRGKGVSNIVMFRIASDSPNDTNIQFTITYPDDDMVRGTLYYTVEYVSPLD